MANQIRTAGLALLVGIAAASSESTAADMQGETPEMLSLAYEHSVYQAAVKQPVFAVRLKSIDPSRPVAVITLTRRMPVTDAGTLYGDTWVSQPSDLAPHCAGKEDAVLALEQTLGIPPDRTAEDHAARFLVRFTADPANIFRPCASSPDITTETCTFDLPKPAENEADRAKQQQGQLFVFAQMWNSYRTGFDGRAGYPFTGMGWTYDWSPESATHVGVSEYVVRGGAPVTGVTRVEPAEFCAATVSAASP